MMKNCVIGVFQTFGEAANAAARVREIGIADDRISIVIDDADEEIPESAAVPENERKIEEVIDKAKSDENDILSSLGEVLTIMAGKFFSGMLDTKAKADVDCPTMADYQRWVSEGKRLLVVLGQERDIDQASIALAIESPLQLNVHYAAAIDE